MRRVKGFIYNDYYLVIVVLNIVLLMFHYKDKVDFLISSKIIVFPIILGLVLIKYNFYYNKINLVFYRLRNNDDYNNFLYIVKIINKELLFILFMFFVLVYDVMFIDFKILLLYLYDFIVVYIIIITCMILQLKYKISMKLISIASVSLCIGINMILSELQTLSFGLNSGSVSVVMDNFIFTFISLVVVIMFMTTLFINIRSNNKLEEI